MPRSDIVEFFDRAGVIKMSKETRREMRRDLLELIDRLRGIGARPSKRMARRVGAVPGADFGSLDGEREPSAFRVTSPNGKLSALISRSGALTYRVRLGDLTVVSESGAGIVAKGVNLGEDVVVGEPISESSFTEYPDRGSSSTAQDRHIRWLFPVRHVPTELEYIFEVKLWDDGFGFRFVFREGTRLLVNREETYFNMPVDAVCWYQTDPVKLQGRTRAQGCRYLPDGEDFACLTAFDLGEGRGYCVLTEAGLYDYPGAALRSLGKGRFSISFWDSGDFYVRDCVSPWRLVIICETLNALVNCKVIGNAADARLPAFDGAEWIIPGKSAWSYFVDKPVSRKFDTIMRYNKLASDMGFEYSLIDSGWRGWGVTEGAAFKKVAQVVADAQQYGVGIFIWKSAKAGPYLPLYRRWFFKKCVESGVAGIKLDHLESESRLAVNLYSSFLREAAERELMVIFHNPQKPTGLSRTYPNLMSMEAIKGMQAGCDPDDNTVLPFTRMTAGDADYTPLCFSVDEIRRGASVPHLLAAGVIYNSSFLTVSESPANILGTSFEDFVRSLPTTWDETIALPASRIGCAAVFARRAGGTWYVAAMNGDRGRRDITLALDFLPITGGKYDLELFFDDSDAPGEAVRRSLEVSRRTKIVVSMLSGGGFAGKITPLPEGGLSRS